MRVNLETTQLTPTRAPTPAPAGGVEAYDAKDAQYFAGVRTEWLDALPANPAARILEIGCGHGDTGRMAIDRGLARTYAGVEVCPEAAAIARGVLTEVVTGDVETTPLPWPAQTFDVLLMSEVLEHLVDPWATLRRLAPLLTPDAVVFASSPNVAHLSVIRMLLRGDWCLADKGIMDRTHLRWFTPRTYADMFEQCGFRVTDVRPHARGGWRSRFAERLLLGQAGWLFHKQIDLRAVRMQGSPACV